MTTTNTATGATPAQSSAPAETPAPQTIAQTTEAPKVSYPDIDALSLGDLRHLITTGIQARPGLHQDSIHELDKRMGYAHARILVLKAEREAEKAKGPATLRRLTLQEANHIAHMCTYGPTDPRPMDQALMEMGLVDFYDETDAVEQTKLGSECLYGPDRLKFIPAEWMSNEERKRAGF